MSSFSRLAELALKYERALEKIQREMKEWNAHEEEVAILEAIEEILTEAGFPPKNKK